LELLFHSIGFAVKDSASESKTHIEVLQLAVKRDPCGLLSSSRFLNMEPLVILL